MQFLRTLIFTVLLMLALVGVYYMGKNRGESDVKNTLLNNQTTVERIAELAALEVRGVSEINVTNTRVSNGIYESLSNLFFENTLEQIGRASCRERVCMLV